VTTKTATPNAKIGAGLVIRLNKQGINDIANLIFTEMQVQNMNYQQVAEKAGCSASTVSKLVNCEHINPKAIWSNTLIGCLRAVGYDVVTKRHG